MIWCPIIYSILYENMNYIMLSDRVSTNVPLIEFLMIFILFIAVLMLASCTKIVLASLLIVILPFIYNQGRYFT